MEEGEQPRKEKFSPESPATEVLVEQWVQDSVLHHGEECSCLLSPKIVISSAITSSVILVLPTDASLWLWFATLPNTQSTQLLESDGVSRYPHLIPIFTENKMETSLLLHFTALTIPDYKLFNRPIINPCRNTTEKQDPRVLLDVLNSTPSWY